MINTHRNELIDLNLLNTRSEVGQQSLHKKQLPVVLDMAGMIERCW